MQKMILAVAVSLFASTCTAKTESETIWETPIDTLTGPS